MKYFLEQNIVIVLRLGSDLFTPHRYVYVEILVKGWAQISTLIVGWRGMWGMSCVFSVACLVKGNTSHLMCHSRTTFMYFRDLSLIEYCAWSTHSWFSWSGPPEKSLSEVHTQRLQHTIKMFIVCLQNVICEYWAINHQLCFVAPYVEGFHL